MDYRQQGLQYPGPGGYPPGGYPPGPGPGYPGYDYSNEFRQIRRRLNRLSRRIGRIEQYLGFRIEDIDAMEDHINY